MINFSFRGMIYQLDTKTQMVTGGIFHDGVHFGLIGEEMQKATKTQQV